MALDIAGQFSVNSGEQVGWANRLLHQNSVRPETVIDLLISAGHKDDMDVSAHDLRLSGQLEAAHTR